MKIYRLENDTKWNYGIRYRMSPYYLRGHCIDIFFFRQKQVPEYGESYQVRNGFFFSINFKLPRIERGFFQVFLRTKKR